MLLNKLLRDGDNEDLADERRKATFDTDEMAAIIWEGRERVRRRREITKIVEEHKELHDPFSPAFMTRHEEIENAARKITTMTRELDKLGVNPSDGPDMVHLTCEVLGINGHPLTIHNVMFIPSLQAQCAEDQMHWLQKALNKEIIGTYAQTELGHGTNLKKLETTATYDARTQEFVLHRITVGDIGPKMAIGAIDNGFLSFDHYRIPRVNMLMKHAKVTSDGKYVRPPHAKVGYSAMVHVRSFMIGDQGKLLAQALTTAIRYSAIRRQGEIRPREGEVKILDYQTQQHRLLPQLARAYAFTFTGRAVSDMYMRVRKDVFLGKVSIILISHFRLFQVQRAKQEVAAPTIRTTSNYTAGDCIRHPLFTLRSECIA
ncbi:hypothetical protein COOONC_14327 [Cooperia oncophora]